ncbi:hypothetical protein PENSPDRAFT_740590 [Peniophora sp. CONT]|nr:hypothetical protein PENSPDRAFT_740590 [Peniophora sp. CONT]
MQRNLSLTTLLSTLVLLFIGQAANAATIPSPTIKGDEGLDALLQRDTLLPRAVEPLGSFTTSNPEAPLPITTISPEGPTPIPFTTIAAAIALCTSGTSIVICHYHADEDLRKRSVCAELPRPMKHDGVRIREEGVKGETLERVRGVGIGSCTERHTMHVGPYYVPSLPSSMIKAEIHDREVSSETMPSVIQVSQSGILIGYLVSGVDQRNSRWLK